MGTKRTQTRTDSDDDKALWQSDIYIASWNTEADN